MITKNDVKLEKRRAGVPKKGNLYYVSEWKKLASPKLSHAIVSMVAYLVYVSLFLLSAIFTAKSIDSMYSADWTWACLWLLFAISNIILRNIAMEIQYRSYSRTYKDSFLKVQQSLYKKILSSKKSSFDDISKEKINNTISFDLVNVSNFYDNFLVTLAGKFVISNVSLIIIFIYNIYAGFLVLGLGIMNFFILSFVNKKLGACNRKTYSYKDKMFEEVSTIVDGKKVINEFNKQKTYENVFMQKSKDYCDSVERYYKWFSFRENGFFACWNVMVYIITFILVYFVSQGELEIAMYLVIVSYLSTCTENFNAMFNTNKFFQDMKVSVDRINTILNVSDEDISHFGNNKYHIKDCNLNFIRVSYENKDKTDESFGTIKKLDLSFKKNEINLIYGNRDCGKRVIFNLLRRRIVPQDGSIFLDDIELSKFDDSIYRENIFYVAGTPLFLHDTIMANLLVATKSKREIYRMCEKVGIDEWIKSLPKGYNTMVENNFSPYNTFMLGLSRSLLTKCKILMIYEMPKGVTDSEYDEIVELINELKKDITIIVFSHNGALKDQAGVVYHIVDGKVESFSENDNTMQKIIKDLENSEQNVEIEKPIDTIVE